MDWDTYFMHIAKVVGEKSHCYSRQIGSVLVKNNRIIATGYNGPPSGVAHCETRNPNNEKECPRRLKGFKSGEGLEWCNACHSEVNCVLQAARIGYSTEGSTLVCHCPTPCLNCTKELINAGIERVVCLKLEEYKSDGLKSIDLFNEAGVKVDVWKEN